MSPMASLKKTGVLLLHDAALPSVSALVAGEPVRGSWWVHPVGKEIFRAANALEDDADVLVAKLVSGKVTFVHRRLWPALAAVGKERAAWQTTKLGRAARTLLARVDGEDQVRASGAAVKELELRLLVHGGQVHTAAGAHATELESWDVFARRERLGRLPAIAAARAELEHAAAALGATARLPW